MTSYVQENVPPFSSFSHQIFSFQRAMFSSKKNTLISTKATWQKWTKFLLQEQHCFQKNFQMETKNMDWWMLATERIPFVSKIFIESNFFTSFLWIDFRVSIQQNFALQFHSVDWLKYSQTVENWIHTCYILFIY